MLELNNYKKIETLYETRMSEQSGYQLMQIKESYEELRSLMYRTAIRLDNDPVIAEAAAGQGVDLSQKTAPMIRLSFNETKNLFSKDSSYIQYAWISPDGNVINDTANEQPSLEDILKWHPLVKKVRSGEETILWDLNRGVAKDSYSMYMKMSEGGTLIIQFQLTEWMKTMAANFIFQQGFYLMRPDGEIVTQTIPGMQLPGGKIDMLISGKSFYDPKQNSLIHSVLIPSANLYLIGQTDLETFFGDIRQIKMQFFLTFALLLLLFMIILFVLLSVLMKPLQLLKKKMSEVVRTQFKTSIRTEKYSGEVLELAQAFNQMVKEINEQLQSLKREERQKEANRFQMLQTQMNPHFLLNTLNNIRWHAYKNKDSTITDICESLGKILESSLSNDADLIHLREELELIRAYVQIQNFRYSDGIHVRYEIDEKFTYALVPKLTLQPLVENSIRHGFAERDYGGNITIRVYSEQPETLILEVEDDGTGIRETPSPVRPGKKKSIALNNLRERLFLLYKTKTSMDLASGPQGTLVRIVVPLLISEPYQSGSVNHVESDNRRG
jgi:two-component system sensor histidine kinase YesM